MEKKVIYHLISDDLTVNSRKLTFFAYIFAIVTRKTRVKTFELMLNVEVGSFYEPSSSSYKTIYFKALKIIGGLNYQSS